MSAVLDSVESRPEPRLSRAILGPARSNPGIVLITSLCLGLYLTYSLTEYAQYLSNGYDLGLFDQAVRAYAHFHAPVSAVKAPGYNLLGDHFSPVMALFVPLYWVWDNPVMLLVAQACLMASSVPIVHRIARRHMDRRVALFVSAFYGLAWPLQAMANFDVHEIAFAVPLLAAALDAADRDDRRRLVLWCAGLLFVKEDMGFTVAAIGAVLVLRNNDRTTTIRNRLRHPAPIGLVLMAGGALSYLITTKVLIPGFAPNGSYGYWQYNAIGSDLPNALANVVARPWHALAVFFSPFPKSLTLAMLLLPLGLVCLRSPYAIIVIPLLAERFFNSRPQLWVPQFHYSALPWLVLVVAFVDGTSRMRIFERLEARSRARTVLFTWMLLWQIGAVWAMASIEEASSAGRALLPRLSGWNNPAVRGREAAVAAIPAGTCIEADNGLIPHLTGHNWVTLPGAPGIRPDFVVYDLSHQWVGPTQTGQPGDPGLVSRRASAATARSGLYRLVLSVGTVRVYRANDYRGPSPACGPLGAGRR